MLLAFIDLETTGFASKTGYNKNGRWVKENVIIEIAALLYDEKSKEVVGEFHEYIKPDKDKIPKKITEITGITNAMVKDCRSEEDVLIDFFDWLLEANPEKLVGHNFKSFDWRFLKDKANRYNIALKEFGIIDTLAEARKKSKEGKLPLTRHTQEIIAKHFHIEYEAHSAIEDVKALIRIYEKLGLNKSDVKQRRREFGF